MRGRRPIVDPGPWIEKLRSKPAYRTIPDDSEQPMRLPTSLSRKAWRLIILVPCILGMTSSLHSQTTELPQRWMDWKILPFNRQAQCAIDKNLEAQTVLNLQKIVLDFVRFNPDYPATGDVETRLGATSEAGCGQAAV